MESLQAYLKEKEGSRGIKIIQCSATEVIGNYVVTYEVIYKDSSFVRNREWIEISEVQDFLYNKILELTNQL